MVDKSNLKRLQQTLGKANAESRVARMNFTKGTRLQATVYSQVLNISPSTCYLLGINLPTSAVCTPTKSPFLANLHYRYTFTKPQASKP